MKTLDSLRNVSTKTIKVLSRLYGVDAKIWEPADIDYKAINGHNDIIYRDEPTIQVKGLCPSYFKYRDYLKVSMLDPFQETPDIFLWTDIQKPFKLYSKVMFITNYKGITTFKITAVHTESDEEGNFIHKHTLVPIYENQEAHNFEQIQKDILDIESIAEFKEDRDTTKEAEQSIKFSYNPLS